MSGRSDFALYQRIKGKIGTNFGHPLRTKEIEHRGEKGHFLGFRYGYVLASRTTTLFIAMHGYRIGATR